MALTPFQKKRSREKNSGFADKQKTGSSSRLNPRSLKTMARLYGRPKPYTKVSWLAGDFLPIFPGLKPSDLQWRIFPVTVTG
jgi:hypothetical protein